MRGSRLVLPSLISLSAWTCGATDSPMVVARQYQRSVLKGDRLVAYTYLTARDTAALSRDAFVGKEQWSLSNATVDSTTLGPDSHGDTSIVFVYGRRPNFQALFASALEGAFTGAASDTAALSHRLREQLRTAPLVTYVDTVVVLREGRRWGVWLGTLERRPLDSLAQAIRDDYLEVPLRDRGARAATWLQLATHLPRSLVPADVKAHMDSLLLATGLVDSLTFAIRASSSRFMRFLEGTVTNASSRRIAEVRLRVWKNGEDRHLSVEGLQPHSSKRVLDFTHLNAGAPDSIVVTDLTLR